ncbi:MAG: hypothetical protein K9L30_13100 [Desulfobacterales bacterium]|nr:hypothetical protein [Desulfobacterales bacterium]
MKYYSSVFSRKQKLKPLDLYEYSLDNYWFKTAGIENQKINGPLRGCREADILIIGGASTIQIVC